MLSESAKPPQERDETESLRFERERTEHLKAIFERFWQVKKGDRGGSFISQQIVKAHGGEIWAKSEPGKGSTLFFTWPGARETEPAPG